jgi:hypothetical protein
VLATRILLKSKGSLVRFCKEAPKYREVEVVALLQKAVMALMLAANPRNLFRQFAAKGSYQYFHDFQLFLREVLQNREYQRFLLYAPPASIPFFSDAVKLAQELCICFMTEGPELLEVRKGLSKLREHKGKTKRVSEFLSESDKALRETLSKHPSGPVFKALDLIRDEGEQTFDPFLMEGTTPQVECVLKGGENDVAFLRMPSPTIQNAVNHAVINEEFKTFLHPPLSHKTPFYHLIINFQDRTSWQEHARSMDLEELSKQAEYAGMFTTITLAKDTDFYNQTGPYQNLDAAEEFITHFSAHLQDESTGYYFPKHLKKALFPHFVAPLLTKVHTLLFGGEKRLDLKARLTFIELAYHLIALKAIELEKPTFFSFGSKDGLDSTATATVGFLGLLTLYQQKGWKEEEFLTLETILYGPTLLSRERAVHPDRVERLVELLRLLEEKQKGLRELLKPFFSKSVLELSPHFPEDAATM